MDSREENKSAKSESKMETDLEASSSLCSSEIKTDHHHANIEGDNYEKVFYGLIGEFGPWQRRVLLLAFLTNIIGMWQNLSITFQALPTRYWCVAVESHRFQALDLAFNRNRTNQCFVTVPSKNNTFVSCVDWEFDLKHHAPTIVSEWVLVCDRSWMVSLATSFFMIGFLTGVFIMGHLSDWIGRYPTILLSYGLALVSSLASFVIKSYAIFVVLRFLMAFGRGALSTICYVLLVEIIGAEYRALAVVIFFLGGTIGFTTLPLVAWFVRDWYRLQLAIVLPIIPFFAVYWIVPESPRWLLVNSKIERFLTVSMKAAEINRTGAKATDIACVCDNFHKKEDQDITTFLSLCTKPGFGKITLIISLAWGISCLAVYSISYNIKSLEGNVYINQFLMGIFQFPMFVFCYFGVNRIGRKPPVIICMVTGGILYALLAFIPMNYKSSRIAIAALVKCCAMGAFGLLYLLTSETFPTVARSTAIGYCSSVARVAAITAPFTKELGEKTHVAVPFIMISILTVISGLLIILVPETKDQMMPDTFESSRPVRDNSTTYSSKIPPEANDK